MVKMAERKDDPNAPDVITDESPLSHVSVNFFAGVGRLVSDAEFYTSRKERPKISFRLAIPRHPRLPHKIPASTDYYQVVCLGDRFLPLLRHLTTGREVVVFGWVQSRDVEVAGKQRTVYEIGAEGIVLTMDPQLSQALEELVDKLCKLDPPVLDALRRKVAAGWPDDEPDALLPSNGNGQVHPEVRLAVEHVLEQRSTGGADGD